MYGEVAVGSILGGSTGISGKVKFDTIGSYIVYLRAGHTTLQDSTRTWVVDETIAVNG